MKESLFAILVVVFIEQRPSPSIGTSIPCRLLSSRSALFESSFLWTIKEPATPAVKEPATAASEFLLPCRRNQNIARNCPKNNSCGNIARKLENLFFLAKKILAKLRKKETAPNPCQRVSQTHGKKLAQSRLQFLSRSFYLPEPPSTSYFLSVCTSDRVTEFQLQGEFIWFWQNKHHSLGHGHGQEYSRLVIDDRKSVQFACHYHPCMSTRGIQLGAPGCALVWPKPHANNFVIGTAVINTHLICNYSGRLCWTIWWWSFYCSYRNKI